MSSNVAPQGTFRLPVSVPDDARQRYRHRGVRVARGGDRRRRADGRLKRALDVLGATLGLLLTAPLLLLIAVAIRLESRGPVLFPQRRRGRAGRPFVIYKFRSMHEQPPGRFRQATRNDPRVTRVGRMLRRLSLDELPQLLNVLEGSMSLVGPRPHPPELDDRFRPTLPSIDERYTVTPGITGWAQTNGSRGGTPHRADMQRRLELDRYYIEHRSILLDLRILLRTALCVWGDEHAC